MPIGAYMLTAAFDAISWLRHTQSWSTDFFKEATLVLAGGFVVSLGAAPTGFMDWRISVPKSTQARRTANAHGITMLTVTALAVIDIVLRLGNCDAGAPTTSFALSALSAIVALVTAFGATIGGPLVFDYGFNVTTAGDSPAWHESDRASCLARTPDRGGAPPIGANTEHLTVEHAVKDHAHRDRSAT